MDIQADNAGEPADGRPTPAQRAWAVLRRALERFIMTGLAWAPPPESSAGSQPDWQQAYGSERGGPQTAPRRLPVGSVGPFGLVGPPPGHPERLVPAEPPSAEEAALWAQLRFLDEVV